MICINKNTNIYIKKTNGTKWELVGGGSVINGAYPLKFFTTIAQMSDWYLFTKLKYPIQKFQNVNKMTKNLQECPKVFHFFLIQKYPKITCQKSNLASATTTPVNQ